MKDEDVTIWLKCSRCDFVIGHSSNVESLSCWKCKGELVKIEEPIPSQYKEQAESLIHQIGQLTNKLWFFVSELGDSLEIECGECKVIILKNSQK